MAKKAGKNVAAAAPAAEAKETKYEKKPGKFLNGVSTKNVQETDKGFYTVKLFLPKDKAIREKYGIAADNDKDITATFAVGAGCASLKPVMTKDENGEMKKPVMTKDEKGNEVPMTKWNIRLCNEDEAKDAKINLIVRDTSRKTTENGQNRFPQYKVSAEDIVTIFNKNRSDGRAASKTKQVENEVAAEVEDDSIEMN